MNDKKDYLLTVASETAEFVFANQLAMEVWCGDGEYRQTIIVGKPWPEFPWADEEHPYGWPELSE